MARIRVRTEPKKRTLTGRKRRFNKLLILSVLLNLALIYLYFNK